MISQKMVNGTAKDARSAIRLYIICPRESLILGDLRKAINPQAHLKRGIFLGTKTKRGLPIFRKDYEMHKKVENTHLKKLKKDDKVYLNFGVPVEKMGEHVSRVLNGAGQLEIEMVINARNADL